MTLNGFAITFVIINGVLLLLLPRRWAPLPLLIGASYIATGPGIEIGPFSFTVIRMLVAVGFVRVILRGERLVGGVISLDKIMLAWAAWAIFTSFFYSDPSAALVFRLGLVYNTSGIYFLVRIFCRNIEDLVAVFRITVILLLPVAAEMVSERVTGYNWFSLFGGVGESPSVREGQIRAQGPFSHAILAGTIGAVMLPIMVGLWTIHWKKMALAGMAACSAMIITSASSGPFFSALAGIGALFMWRFRHNMRMVRWAAVFGYIGLEIVMKAPAYYLIARVDAVGGSTGWHRARLIQSSMWHLNEWWIVGTEYTRHWMPTGVTWSPNHTDITNHYIYLGVLGGLPLMILFIFVLAKTFSYIGQIRMKRESVPDSGYSFFIWAVGASLFAQVATMISVSYFDQSFVFLYLTLAATGSIWASTVGVPLKNQETVVDTRYEHQGLNDHIQST